MENLSGASVIRYRENGELITVKINKGNNSLIEILEREKSVYDFKIEKCKMYIGENNQVVDEIKSVVPVILKTTKHQKSLEEYVLKVYYCVAVSYKNNKGEGTAIQNYETFLDIKESKKDELLNLNNVRWKYISNDTIEVSFNIFLKNSKK